MIAIPVIIALLAGGAYLKRGKVHGVMTAERTKIFNAALAGGMQDPDNLEKLAKTFAGEGLPEQAALLKQRANLKRLPNEIKLARRQVWRKAVKSKNKDGILRLASAYDKEGCTSAAMRLREIASGLPDVVPETQTRMSGEITESPVTEPAGEPTETATVDEETEESSPEEQATE